MWNFAYTPKRIISAFMKFYKITFISSKIAYLKKHLAYKV